MFGGGVPAFSNSKALFVLKVGDMTKAPAFQFYPADWLNDIKLQSCSLESQGLLINLMCIMHQSKPYGYLMINGSIPPMKAVCKVLRLHHKTYQARLKELLLYGVLSKDENGCIFCKRMVKDEQIRGIRRSAGKLGGNPLLKQKVKHVSKQKSTPSSSSSSSSSSSNNKDKIIKKISGNNSHPEKIYSDYILKIIPFRKSKMRSVKNIARHLKNHPFEDLISAIENYSLIALKSDPEFRKDPANFFGIQEPSFVDYLPGNFEPPKKVVKPKDWKNEF